MADLPQLRIDFVSDVSCPWCAIGLASLQEALARLGDTLTAQIHPQPFELNPQMGAGGEDATGHLMRKYGGSAEQIDASRQALRARGAAVGFEFNLDRRSRVFNTFDAHRLLHWAAQEDRDLALKQALLRSYFTNGQDIGSHDTLVELAGSAGLDRERARQVLSSNAYAEEVRDREQYYLRRGIHSVPATIVNGREMIAGGQPPEVFEQALRRIAADLASAAAPRPSLGRTGSAAR